MSNRRRAPKWKRLRKSHDDPDLTRPYTPQDESALIMAKNNGAGILRASSSERRLPNRLEDIGEGKTDQHPYRVMIVIVTLALAFIALVAYLVSQMPPKP
jgi:hypothetical protein